MKHRRNQRGVALIMCLFALMLLSGVGLGMMYMADTETTINRNYRDSQQAYFAAMAGLQEVRERIGPSAAVGRAIIPPSTMPGGGISTGVFYVLNWGNGVAKSAIHPWTADTTYFDTEFCHENFRNAADTANLVTATAVGAPCGAVPSGTPTYIDSTMPAYVSDLNANLPYRWVRITRKANNSAAPYYVISSSSANNVPICWDGTRQLPAPAGYTDALGRPLCEMDPPPDAVTYLKPVYVLTSLAVTSAGSRRMVQTEVANDPPLVTNAAVDTDNFVNVTGASVTVNGYDNCKCSCTAGVGGAAPSCTNRVGGGACTGNTFAIYSSKSVTTSGDPALVAGTTQTGCVLPACNPAVAQNQTFPYDIDSLVNKYTSMAGVVNTSDPGGPYKISCSSGSPYPNCGKLQNGSFGTLNNEDFPPANPNNPQGYVNQITYVPGSFDIEAKTSGAGVLVVDGDLTINAGLNFYGIIIVRGRLIYKGSGNGQDLNVLGSVVAGKGTLADALSGGINIQYDRCALQHNLNPQPPLLLSTHELMY